jgi:uncharacterized protein (TIGR02246 family)
MNKLILAVGLALALTSAAPGNVMAFATAAPAEDIANEKLIRSLYENFESAWNTHEGDRMADMWAIDGDHVEPDGHVAKGREEVRDLFTKQHTAIFGETTLDLTIDSVWFITRAVALIDGQYSISGIVGPEGKAIPQRRGRLTSILILEKNRWLIAASRLMVPTQLPYKPE